MVEDQVDVIESNPEMEQINEDVGQIKKELGELREAVMDMNSKIFKEIRLHQKYIKELLDDLQVVSDNFQILYKQNKK